MRRKIWPSKILAGKIALAMFAGALALTLAACNEPDTVSAEQPLGLSPSALAVAK